MNYKEHRNAGIGVGVILSVIIGYLTSFDIKSVLLTFWTTLIFSLYPDLDIASKPSRYSMIIGIISTIYLYYINNIEAMMILIGFITIPRLFKHRGMVHTIKFGILATYAWFYFINLFTYVNIYYIMIPGIIGYITHLLLDNNIKI